MKSEAIAPSGAGSVNTRLSQKAVERLREWIAAQGYETGQWLPPERELAVSLNLSRETLRKALIRLRNDNVLELRGRRGHRLYTGAPATDGRPAAPRRLARRVRRIGITMWGSEMFSQNPSMQQMLVGLQEACQNRNTVVEMVVIPNRGDNENAWDEWINVEGRDGMVVCVQFSPATLTRVIQNGYPMVFLNQNGLLPEVCEDLCGAVRLLTRHFVGLGHTRIAMLAGPGRHQVRQSIHAFYEEHEAAGLPCDPLHVCLTEYTGHEGYQRTTDWLRTLKPTAIIAGDGLLGQSAWTAIQDAGLRCPDDVSVATLTDEWRPDAPKVSSFGVAFTATYLPHREAARRAGEILIQWLDGKKPAMASELLPVELRVRDTSGPCRE